MVVDENRRIRAEGRNEGIIEGRAEGILQIIKEMLKNGMKEKEIMKYTNINKKEIEEIRKSMKK